MIEVTQETNVIATANGIVVDLSGPFRVMVRHLDGSFRELQSGDVINKNDELAILPPNQSPPDPAPSPPRSSASDP